MYRRRNRLSLCAPQAVCYGEDVRYVAAEIEGLSGAYVLAEAALETLSQILARRVTVVREVTGECCRECQLGLSGDGGGRGVSGAVISDSYVAKRVNAGDRRM